MNLFCNQAFEFRLSAFSRLVMLTAAVCLIAGCQVSDAPEGTVPVAVDGSDQPADDPDQVLATESVIDDDSQPAFLPVSRPSAPPNPLDGTRALGFLEQICDLGPRVTGSAPMVAQQKLLTAHFEELGGQVQVQRFRFPHPRDGSPHAAANLVVSWHPQTTRRILLCAHYDTRPEPDNENVPRHERGTLFLGANDGASGVALLMELGYEMPKLQSRYGVDFLLVDAEEFVFSDLANQRYFVGSEYFSRDYVRNPPSHRYHKGAVLDMIGDRHLQIYQDRNSVWWKDTRPVTQEIWATANRLGVNEFIARTHPKMRIPIRDDHLMLHNVGKIPTCEIIDFDYPRYPVNRYWHTAADTPEKCSADSLAKVGWVMLEWIRTAP